jgi:myosin heavy subunit
MFKYLNGQSDFKDVFNDNNKVIQIGSSKIFMKDEVKNILECKLNQAVRKYILKIQAICRKILIRKKMKVKRRMVQILHKKVRGFLMRNK